jgi:hypothetical protein
LIFVKKNDHTILFWRVSEEIPGPVRVGSIFT